MSRSELHRFLYLVFVTVIGLTASSGHAQSVKVLDATTLEFIPDVGVFNLEKSRYSQTNDRGEADLSMFESGDMLEFQHPSYKNVIIPLNEVIATGVIRMVEEVIKIQEVIISAGRWEQQAIEVPQTVISITPKEIDFYNPQSAADALAITGQVFVQKSQLGGGSPKLRGFAANSVLISVNGIRMNNAIFRSGNLQNVINIDPNILESVEVVLGPGSVLYGSDALGGVMNFRIKDPQFSPSEDMIIKSTGFLRYSATNNEQTGHIHLNVGGRKLSWLSSFTYSNFDNLKTGSKRTAEFPDYGKRTEYVIRGDGKDIVVKNANENLQVFSGYNTFNTIQRLKLRPSDFYDITYDFYYSTTSDIPRYDRLIIFNDGIPESAEWNYGPQKWMMNALQFDFYRPTGLYNDFRIVLANQRFEESRIDRKFQNVNRRKRIENVSAWTLNVDMEKDLNDNRLLIYGAEAVYNEVQSEAESLNIETSEVSMAGTRYPDGGSTLTNLAAYIIYKNKLSEKILFSAGTRYSHLFLESFFDNTFYNFPFSDIIMNTGALTGNASVVYNTANNWKFDFLAGSGFRAPNVDDIGKVFDSAPGYVVVPNPNLAPEYVYNGEIRMTKTVPGVLKAGLTGFYTRLTNAMARRDFTVNGQDSIMYDGTLSKVEALVNVGNAYIAGLSADLKMDISEHFTLSSSVTVMDGRDTEENIPLRHTTPAFGKTSLEFRGNKFRAALYADYQAAKAFEDLAPTEQSKTHLYTTDGALGWSTLNLNVSYQPGAMIQLNAALENIFDKHYRPYSSGISAPGRNLIVSLRVSI